MTDAEVSELEGNAVATMAAISSPARIPARQKVNAGAGGNTIDSAALYTTDPAEASDNHPVDEFTGQLAPVVKQVFQMTNDEVIMVLEKICVDERREGELYPVGPQHL